MGVKVEMPHAACPLGYPIDQVELVLGKERTEQFIEFMRLSKLPIAECTGITHSFLYNRWHTTSCHGRPHGAVYYSVDIHRFLAAEAPVRVRYTHEGQAVERWVWGLVNS